MYCLRLYLGRFGRMPNSSWHVLAHAYRGREYAKTDLDVLVYVCLMQTDGCNSNKLCGMIRSSIIRMFERTPPNSITGPNANAWEEYFSFFGVDWEWSRLRTESTENGVDWERSRLLWSRLRTLPAKRTCTFISGLPRRTFVKIEPRRSEAFERRTVTSTPESSTEPGLFMWTNYDSTELVSLFGLPASFLKNGCSDANCIFQTPKAFWNRESFADNKNNYFHS